MAYLTSANLDAALGAAKVASLTPDATAVAYLISQATAEVEAALSVGGYAAAIPSTVYLADATDCPKVIALATFGAWLELAYGRNDLELPEAYRAYVRKIEDIRSGKLEIDGVAHNVARAVGGVAFSVSDPTVSVADGSRPTIFGRKTMGGY